MTLIASAMFGLLGLSFAAGTLLAIDAGVLTVILLALTTLLLAMAILLLVRGRDRRLLAIALVAAALLDSLPVSVIAGLGGPSVDMTQAWEFVVPLTLAVAASLIALVLAPRRRHSQGSIAT